MHELEVQMRREISTDMHADPITQTHVFSPSPSSSTSGSGGGDGKSISGDRTRLGVSAPTAGNRTGEGASAAAAPGEETGRLPRTGLGGLRKGEALSRMGGDGGRDSSSSSLALYVR